MWQIFSEENKAPIQLPMAFLSLQATDNIESSAFLRHIRIWQTLRNQCQGVEKFLLDSMASLLQMPCVPFCLDYHYRFNDAFHRAASKRLLKWLSTFCSCSWLTGVTSYTKYVEVRHLCIKVWADINTFNHLQELNLLP